MTINGSQVIEEVDLTENLKHVISVAYDESKVFLEVDYMGGKFTLQRTFVNNYIGVDQMEDARREFDSEDKVKQYFGI